MTVDAYRYPALRRVGLGLLRIEATSLDALRALRRVSGWMVVAVGLALLAIVVQTWLAVVVFGIAMALNAAMWVAERRRERLWEISAIDSMSGREFEDWLEGFFERIGFDVERTSYQGDYGADHLLTWNGIRVAVQAKSGHQNVGVSAVQQVVAAKAHYGCEQAIVVTTQYFTRAAVLLAESNGVRLRSRDDLTRKLDELSRPSS